MAEATTTRTHTNAKIKLEVNDTCSNLIQLTKLDRQS